MRNKNNTNRIKWILGLAVLGMIAAGCAQGQKNIQPVMTQPAETFAYDVPEKPDEGAVYVEQSAFTDLFVNPKAKRVGDIITIKIVENSSATNNANTTTGRSSNLAGQMNAFFNFENKYTADQDTFNPFGSVKGGMESEFEGTGSTSRSGDLSAYITARIVDVLPNGNFAIAGTREVQINNEKQYIILKGIIRPRDISSGNVILSTFISDAKIAYSGSGVIDDRQKPGWMANILNKAWPF
jgi:flagellar L-ring protein precursor FlgH